MVCHVKKKGEYTMLPLELILLACSYQEAETETCCSHAIMGHAPTPIA